MNLARTILGLLICIAVLAVVWHVSTDNDSVVSSKYSDSSGACPDGQPLTYQVGAVDSRFKIDPEAVGQAADAAAGLWNEAYETDLLHRDPEGDIIVSLEYDDRQQQWEDKQKEQAAVDRARERHQRVAAEYDETEASYQALREEYEELVAQLDSEVQVYNERVRRWNAGELQQTREKADQLNKAGRHIEMIERDVGRLENQLERRRMLLNKLADRANQVQTEVNGRIESFNRQFAESNGFNKGEFIRQGQRLAIKIYQFDDVSDLKRALSHEFGHALGLRHVDEPSAIMYHRMTDANRDRRRLSSPDRELLDSHCGTNS